MKFDIIAANPATISELLDRLQAAENDAAHQKALAESALRVAEGWERKCGELRAKVEHVEKQEPVAFGLYSGWALKATYLKEHEACEQRDRRQLTADLGGSLEAYRVAPLYALPGAQPAPSVSDGWKEAAIAWEVCGSLHREYAKGKDPFFKKRQEDFVKHANDARAMIAAAQEAKP